MAKIIKYKLLTENKRKIPVRVPHIDDTGSPILDDNGKPVTTVEMREETKQTFANCSICCPTKDDYEKNLSIAQREAYNGEYTVEGEFDPEPETPLAGSDVSVWDELDAAYQAGYKEGVESV